MTNLINNSLVHAFPKDAAAKDRLGRERACTIRITAVAVDADHLKLDISDNGSGVAPSILGRIFDPFFTSKLGQGGSGLGLHIVHNIVVDILAGTIAVSSEVDAGTTFSITIPRITPIQDAALDRGSPS
jgi:signal transduction histidine kinase